MGLAAVSLAQVSELERKQDEAECRAFVAGYTHDGATTAEVHRYSWCADVLYPLPSSGGEIFVAKVVVASVLGAIAGGMIFAKLKPFGLGRYLDMSDGAFLGFITCVSVWILLGAVGFLVYA